MKKDALAIPQNFLCGLRAILCLGLIGFEVLWSFFCCPANIKYHVTERYDFSGEGEDGSVYLGVMLPKSGPYQWVGNIEISWDGVQQEERHDFVDVIKLSGKKVGRKTWKQRLNTM